MKKATTTLFFIFAALTVFAQYNYDVSEAFPFGQANPNAPEQVKDFDALIGKCNCKSTTRKQDGTWNKPEDIIWTWRYIMNGTAVQDETLKPDGSHSGSIRQFIADSSKWYVHWYSSKTPSTKFPVWKGNKKDDKIILYKPQKAPNGTDGFYRLTFYNISKLGYKWVGEWVDKTESVIFLPGKLNVLKTKYYAHRKHRSHCRSHYFNHSYCYLLRH